MIFSLASFSIKISMTIAGIVPTVVFMFVNYVPNGTQSAECLTAIKAMNSLVPAVILLIGIIVYRFYPLTEKKFDEIVVELTKRRLKNSGESVE